LFKKEHLAFVAALIFALHPVAGETVNFLAGGRNTLLSACFGLLSLLFYIRKKTVPALISFTVAIFSKEFALLLPFVFIFHDFRLQREKLRITRYAPFLIPIAAYLTLRSFAVQKANFLDSINISDSATAPYLVVRYALNMLLPLQLKVLYSASPTVVSGMICLALAGAVSTVVYYFRRHDEILFSASWALLFLLPVINIIPLRTTTVLADRYAYFSLMGFALFLASLLCKLNGRYLTVAVAMLCTLYAVIDFRHNSFWKNDISFFTRMTKDAPESFVGFKNLGLAHYRQGDIARALQTLEKADTKEDITVKYLIGDAYIFWKENRLDKAESSLLRVVEVNPSNPEPYLLLMLISNQRGNMPLADSYRDNLKKMGLNVEQVLADRAVELCRAGETYISRRQYSDAEIHLWQALRIKPGYLPALIDMGSMKAEQGDYANAIQYLNRALAIDPLSASAHFNLAMVYKMQGRFSDAQNEMIRFRETEALVHQKPGNDSNHQPDRKSAQSGGRFKARPDL
jgi:tetratricopeptide (TPR) repeat protein